LYDIHRPAAGQESFKENKKMQTKLISQAGLKVRTNCRLGYFTFFPNRGNPLTEAQGYNNKCIAERDLRTVGCELALWPQDGGICTGNNNGKELDKCMATVWGPADLKTYRSQGGTPYASPDGGDKCFNEFYGRYQEGWAIAPNKVHWDNCLAKVP
jgi:hypothetical protein